MLSPVYPLTSKFCLCWPLKLMLLSFQSLNDQPNMFHSYLGRNRVTANSYVCQCPLCSSLQTPECYHHRRRHHRDLLCSTARQTGGQCDGHRGTTRCFSGCLILQWSYHLQLHSCQLGQRKPDSSESQRAEEHPRGSLLLH